MTWKPSSLRGSRRSSGAPSPVVTLAHGDAKPGNFAFVGDRLSATLDWELASGGDPMADIAYAQVTWRLPSMFTRCCAGTRRTRH